MTIRKLAHRGRCLWWPPERFVQLALRLLERGVALLEQVTTSALTGGAGTAQARNSW
ncbi:hypothetical protein [Cupriavidus basilensis]|uniref:hypothetical protein n=1 Tax=Cupriavidus basilensis TaxID=68895 RepID=UPI003204AF74